MKIKISIIDDDGRTFEGETDLHQTKQTGKKDEKKPAPSNASNFKGLTGGIELLISQGFFTTPKAVKEITAELKREGYFHQRQAVDKILRISFVLKKKILKRIEDKKIWHYVLRK